MELVRRSLIQVDEVSFKGIPKTCRVHDLVSDVILSKSKELSFCHVSRSCSTFKGIARHLPISNRGSDIPKGSTKSQTRSIMVFDKVELQKATISRDQSIQTSKINQKAAQPGVLGFEKFFCGRVAS
ncbi:unnamed protein product [Dovyalis caffra]|uniref:Uncharacterized protein n=1 Tax=Dovyalis caffra TaxID=77055 RepID=A0AAV1RZ28_9ROSI|nr:unnamed protein product [Dovyalis caffra]